MSTRLLFKHWFTPLLALLITGCQSAAYYGQAASGQVSLLAKRKSIPRLIASEKTPEALRKKLETVQRIRAFAREELGLPAKRQYGSYVELGRPYPVWSVMATPELSLQTKTWCYWFVGCLAYRGFFKEASAQKYAEQLRGEGYDVYLSGIPAYSTLGWFRDPVLSSFVYQGDTELAELLFHELAHQLLFIPGDTVFNESFAVTVAEEGLRRFNAVQPVDFQRLDLAKSRRDDFVRLVMEYRRQLAQAFAAAPTEAAKREAKARVYAELREAYAQQKQLWGGYTGYDAWFSDVNNAKLNTVATYYDDVPALKQLLASLNHELPRFYAACHDLAKLDSAARRLQLRQYVATLSP